MTVSFCKTDRVIELLKAGRDLDALKIASKFRILPNDVKTAVQRGWSAVGNAAFYTEIGQNPETLTLAGIAALRAFYKV